MFILTLKKTLRKKKYKSLQKKYGVKIDYILLKHYFILVWNVLLFLMLENSSFPELKTIFFFGNFKFSVLVIIFSFLFK